MNESANGIINESGIKFKSKKFQKLMERAFTNCDFAKLLDEQTNSRRKSDMEDMALIMMYCYCQDMYNCVPDGDITLDFTYETLENMPLLAAKHMTDSISADSDVQKASGRFVKEFAYYITMLAMNEENCKLNVSLRDKEDNSFTCCLRICVESKEHVNVEFLEECVKMISYEENGDTITLAINTAPVIEAYHRLTGRFLKELLVSV